MSEERDILTPLALSRRLRGARSRNLRPTEIRDSTAVTTAPRSELSSSLLQLSAVRRRRIRGTMLHRKSESRSLFSVDRLYL